MWFDSNLILYFNKSIAFTDPNEKEKKIPREIVKTIIISEIISMFIRQRINSLKT